MNSKNIASTLSIIQTKQIINGFLLILSMMIISLFVSFIVVTNWNSFFLLILFIIWFVAILSLLYFSILELMKSKKKEHYNYLSKLLK